MPEPAGHDPLVQRHAVLAVHGLRPRDGRHAHAAHQPFPRSFLLLSKLLGGVAVAAIQAYVFLGIFYFWEAEIPYEAHLALLALPALLCALLIFNATMEVFSEALHPGHAPWPSPWPRSRCLSALSTTGSSAAFDELHYGSASTAARGPLMLGSLALFISSVIKQLENFAGVMNFVIFPMFFASSALYPLWKIRGSSPILFEICRLNPFTYAGGAHPVRLVRTNRCASLRTAALDLTNLYVVTGYAILFLGAAVYAYNPSRVSLLGAEPRRRRVSAL